MKILFLSRYQNIVNRGAEVFVSELAKRLSLKHEVKILPDQDSGSYDVVIPMNGGMQVVKASLGRIFKRYKLVVSGQAGIGRTSIINLMAAPDIFVALTDYMAKWASRWAWKSKIVKIPNGVDLSKFNSDGDKLNLGLEKPIILCVGALTWYKHHERIIEAMRFLDKGSLLIVGEGEQKKYLEEKGKRILGDRFKIQSFDYADMPPVYRSCDLFTLPSWDREAFGIVYLEAMASGLPVVAPNDLSRREIIGDAGIFVDTSDPEVYAKEINEGMKKNWKDLPRNQAEKFSWDKIAKDYEKIILI